MNLHYPINTTARFLWQDRDGAMRMGIGTTRDISRKGVWISAYSVPAPGTEVQVIVDLPSLQGGCASGRFMGKGVAVRVEHANGRTSGFAAEVRFQIGRAGQLPLAKSDAIDARKLATPARTYEHRRNPAIDFDSAAHQVAFGRLAEVNGQLQAPAA